MTLSVIFYPYHCVRAILSIPFCPMPFCPYTILSIPFCPYHFVRYHFVLEPSNLLISCSILLNQAINLQIKSSPSYKKQDPFLERKKEKVSRFLKARKWSPYST